MKRNCALILFQPFSSAYRSSVIGTFELRSASWVIVHVCRDAKGEANRIQRLVVFAHHRSCSLPAHSTLLFCFGFFKKPPSQMVVKATDRRRRDENGVGMTFCRSAAGFIWFLSSGTDRSALFGGFFFSFIFFPLQLLTFNAL